MGNKGLIAAVITLSIVIGILLILVILLGSAFSILDNQWYETYTEDTEEWCELFNEQSELVNELLDEISYDATDRLEIIDCKV